MRSAWSDADARAAVAHFTARDPLRCNEDLALRVYSSRLHRARGVAGAARRRQHLGEDGAAGRPRRADRVACIKGSGWDLASIEPPGLPAVRLGPLQALRRLASLATRRWSTPCARGCSTPRAEPLGRGAAARILAAQVHRPLARGRGAGDRRSGAGARAVPRRVRRRLRGRPVRDAGLRAGKLAAEAHEAAPGCHGLVLLGHGLFSFGPTRAISYERHIHAVTRAEAWVGRVSVQVPGDPRRATAAR
jgi:rhamnose utilization protein RhaD (predicted bifunctional aldolase and dehydrogenase)